MIADRVSMISEKPFLATLNGKMAENIPCWFMRQAGRYLPEYRELRAKKNGFLDMAFDPDSACEITMQPIRRFGMDAAIIFSDILVIPYALGQSLEFVPGEGPKLEPIRDAEGIYGLNADRLHERLSPVYEALRNTRSALQKEGYNRTALIGFAGSPWTVATYMIEGGGSKDFRYAKAMAYGQPKLFKTLMDMLIAATASYLIAQVEAGAEALQLFDSWAGALDPHGFQYQSIEPTREIVRRVKAVHPDIPIIGFPRGAGVHTRAYAEQTDIDAVALDSLMCTHWAKNNLQSLMSVQGSLDPMRLLAGGEGLEKAATKILKDFSGGPHIFNLGHGIHKETPPDHVEKLVRIIRDFKRA